MSSPGPLLFILVSFVITCAYDIVPCPGIQVGTVESEAKTAISDPEEGENGACVCVPSTQYNIRCPPGFYCPADGGQFKCTPGFYCPANVSQPTYCCKGHFCPTASEMKICTEGHFCPNAIIEPISCGGLTSCPEGTFEVRPGGPLAGIIVIFAVLYFGNLITNYTYKWKQERHVNHTREWARRPELLDVDEHDRLSVIEKRVGNNEKKKAATFEIKPKVETVADHNRTITCCCFDSQPNDQQVYVSMGNGGQDGEESLEIVYRDLWFVLPNGKAIMKGVSGVFRKGRSMAVMGPSGAGKSTLFNLVMGKAKRTKGTVEINGKVDELYNYSDLIGFVPQEDVMLRQLTVYDILRFSADYRLPASYTEKQRRDAALASMEFLEIDHVVNTIIGDENKRGVSGGQRKRVNIAMELVANPKVLFLDEPTSGLDAVTSQTLATVLRDLARSRGISVAAVIHSPSQKTFEMFDDLTLLGAGGRLIYQGPIDRAPQYFQSIGFPVPPEVNPADFYLEVAMGKVPQRASEVKEMDEVEKNIAKPFDPTKLYSLWYEKGRDYRPEGLRDLVNPDSVEDERIGGSDEKKEDKGDDPALAKDKNRSSSELWWLSTKEYWSEVWEEFYYFITLKDPKKARVTPNYFRIFFWCCQRTYYQIYRDGSWIQRLFLHVGLGLFLSAIGTSWFIGPLPAPTCETAPTAQAQSCVLPLQDQALGIGTFGSWAISFAGMVEGINTFGLEQVVFWRHASRGLPTIPYFAAKVFLDLPLMVLASSLFYFGISFGYSSLGESDNFFGFIFFNYWVGYSMGYFLSVVIEPHARSLYAVIFAMMWVIVFSGGVVRLSEVEHEYSSALAWIWDISFTRYGIEAFYVNELDYYLDYMVGLGNALSILDYKRDNFPVDFGAMFGIGLMWQFLTFLLMKLLNRDKRK